MINAEDSSTSDNETDENNQNSAVVLLNNLSAMINNASLRLSENLSSAEPAESSASSVVTTYDKTIAAKHEYLGTDLEEVAGRTIHDAGSILWLPILMELQVVLVPGQTLPLTVFFPPIVSMFRKIIAKDKTFGVVCVNSLAQYGTTAEIYQYQDNNNAGFKIKAKGRQRFKLLEQKRQTPGVLLGKVLILPEISLVSPLNSSRFMSLDKYRKNSSVKPKINFFDASPTPWPSWIYRQYDIEFLVAKVTEELKNFYADVYNSVLPTNPVDLSYWITQSLPMDEENRVRLLSFNSALERLQYALTLLSKSQKLYCVNCGNCLADQKDIFSMSVDGPQGMYCNPSGYVHDVVTIYNGTGMSLESEYPSSQCSWFPGYGWIIAQCSNCDCHIGWLFVAMKRDLNPVKFWGLSRKSITTHQKGLFGLLV